MTTTTAPVPDAGQRLSTALVTIFGSLVVAAVVAGAAGVLRVEGLNVRVEQLEKQQPALLDVGKQLGRLATQVDGIDKAVGELREDLRAARKQPPSPR